MYAGLEMITKDEFRKFDNDLFNINLLFESMLLALKYFESETSQCGEIVYFGEIIQGKIKDILNKNDKILLDE